MTAYVFTGQGLQEPRIGMDLYNSFPAPCAVWGGANEHLHAVYGFSILKIVKDNPKKKTIHFGGIKGQAIRQWYMDISYNTMDKNSHVKTLPLFATIDIQMHKYTFSHPNGLLFSTQFIQIALNNCAFTGHSLGEYSALASIADVLAISALSFNDAALREVVDTILMLTNTLLQIVNFNIEGQQYICAGELVALQTLTNVLNYLRVKKIDIAKLTEMFRVKKVKEMLGNIVKKCHSCALDKQKAEGYIKPKHGFATIPLPDLPKKIDSTRLNPDVFIGKYIPSLITKLFKVLQEYAQIIHDQTSWPHLTKVLKKWDKEKRGSAAQHQNLAYIILMELLVYQFTLPIYWIQTQDLLFSHFKLERLNELSPSPTLTRMTTHTLKVKYETQDDLICEILCHAKNTKALD
ncbi:hypothetical protein GYMLUDRAFT_251664 [Collybiopsis luxurians FD-317 M1]|uniref:Unplaced genomic scaffold GYMLUscaffold_104, whole genome shotgun sequence n=1 Tax=Collybiopsis luxurians FD-317 M1 TaxID=944289 RepID=A0A0D0ANS5_9AGAR|nr:hypothetical protein GYMLUDRAFT_251664 [Collybiopsis luxurians FD-317 M1]